MQIALHPELHPLLSMAGKITENVSQMASIVWNLKFDVFFRFGDGQHFGGDALNEAY